MIRIQLCREQAWEWLELLHVVGALKPLKLHGVSPAAWRAMGLWKDSSNAGMELVRLKTRGIKNVIQFDRKPRGGVIETPERGTTFESGAYIYGR